LRSFIAVLTTTLIIAISAVTGASIATAQTMPRQQLEQFKNLPIAQQRALARQYGIDLGEFQAKDSIGGRGSASQPDYSEDRQSAEQGDDARADRARPEMPESYKDKSGLDYFGYSLFSGKVSTFAPVDDVPVPANYVVGPGDTLRIQLWGQQNDYFELQVSRNGTIELPESGPITVAGLSFDETSRQIKEQIARKYRGVDVSVGLGSLRSIGIFVLGEANTPGSYTVSSLATITNALRASGGVALTGSLRNIELKRDGKPIATLDLYDFLLRGDTSDDQRLQPGDVIFIPPVGPRVSIEGEVLRPAIYELKKQRSLQHLISMAGGTSATADLSNLLVARQGSSGTQSMREADIAGGQTLMLESGDEITVRKLPGVAGNYVEVDGAAIRSGRFAWAEGLRISDLFPDLQSSFYRYADHDSAAIVRTDSATGEVSVISLALRRAVLKPGSEADVVLHNEDRILIFADPRVREANDTDDQSAEPSNGWHSSVRSPAQTSEKGEAEQHPASREALLQPVLDRLEAAGRPNQPVRTIKVQGAVAFPGRYPLPTSERLDDVIRLAGGLLASASTENAELTRFSRGESGIGRAQVQEVNLDQAAGGGASVQLQPMDRILIKSVPEFGQSRSIELQGEVLFPGVYTFEPGENLASLIRRAGGLTRNAFPEGAVFTRENLRKLEAQRLEEAQRRLEGDLLGVRLNGNGIGGDNADRIEQVEGLLEEVQSARPLGRMVIDLPAIVAGTSGRKVRLQDGDRLYIPEIPEAVTVFGEVQYPTSHFLQAGLTVNDYVNLSGGTTRQADEDRIYVVRADGSVKLPRKSRWFGGATTELRPGDTIVVPIDVDRLNQLELWTNVSQIIYQIALGAAAVGNL